jgi:hypothetical protein
VDAKKGLKCNGRAELRIYDVQAELRKCSSSCRVSYSSVVVRNRGLEELARVQNRGLEDQHRVQKTKAE